MTFEEAASHYGQLRQQLETGALTPEAFYQACSQLQVQAPDGHWWRIEPETGGWQYWDGQDWVPGVNAADSLAGQPQTPPPGDEAAAPAAQVVPSEAAPSPGFSWRRLPWIIVGYVLRRLPIMLLTWLGAMVLHTCAVVVWNDGFCVDSSKRVDGWINVLTDIGGRPAYFSSVLAIWGMASALLWAFAISLFRVGPKRAVTNAVAAPFRIFTFIGSVGVRGLGAFLLGAGTALLLSLPFHFNRPAGYVLGVTWTFMGLSRPGLLVARAVAGGAAWIASLVTRRKQERGEPAVTAAQLLVAGIAPGLLLSAVVKEPRNPVLLGVLLVVVGLCLWVIFSRPFRPLAALGEATSIWLVGSVVALLAVLADMLWARRALAHDGGLQEYMDGHDDGTVADYAKNDPGAGKSVTQGVAPSSSAAGGGLTPPLDDKDEERGRTSAYHIEIRVAPESLSADGTAAARVDAWVVCDDPSVKSFALTQPIVFAPGGQCGAWLRVSAPVAAGNASSVSVTAWAPEDQPDMAGPYTASVTATATSPDGVALSGGVNLFLTVPDQRRSPWRLDLSTQTTTLVADGKTAAAVIARVVRDDPQPPPPDVTWIISLSVTGGEPAIISQADAEAGGSARAVMLTATAPEGSLAEVSPVAVVTANAVSSKGHQFSDSVSMYIAAPGKAELRASEDDKGKDEDDAKKGKKPDDEGKKRKSWFTAPTTEADRVYVETLFKGVIKDLAELGRMISGDPEVWKPLAKEGLEEALKQVKDKSARELVRMIWDKLGLGKAWQAIKTGELLNAIRKDPVGFVKRFLGSENWSKVVDPNTNLPKRVLRALYGAVDLTLKYASAKGLVTGPAGTARGLGQAAGAGRTTLPMVRDAGRTLPALAAEAGKAAGRSLPSLYTSQRAIDAADGGGGGGGAGGGGPPDDPYPGRRPSPGAHRPHELLPDTDQASGYRQAEAAAARHHNNRDGVWDQRTLEKRPQLQQQLDRYDAGQVGSSVRNLDLSGRTPEQIHDELAANGFTRTRGPLAAGRDGAGNTLYKTIDGRRITDANAPDVVVQDIYEHPDGGVVRVKPEGDPGHPFRPEVHASKSVKMDPTQPPTWQNEGFKVTNGGRPVPKAPCRWDGMKQGPTYERPEGADPEQIRRLGSGYKDSVMSQAHTNCTTAMPPGNP